METLRLLSSVLLLYILNACSGASPDNTIVPPTSSIVDNSGNNWTLNVTLGYIYENGVKDSSSYNVIKLLWIGGVLYQENTSGQFYKWTGSTWVSSGASVDNTTVPSASSITDNSGNLWTLNATLGFIYKNGVKDSSSSNVVKLYWTGGYVYQQNTGGAFYRWVSGGWASACLTTSADGTTIPSASVIVDKSCNNWTLSNGYIYKNGIQDQYSYSVSQLLWYGGMIYQVGSGGQFYVLPFNGPWLKSSDPRIAKAANSGSFYGINGHYDYIDSAPVTVSTIVSTLQSLGCSTYRIGLINDSHQLNNVISHAKTFQSSGLKLFTLINYGLRQILSNGSIGNIYPDETTAYNTVKAGAAAIATALQSYGVNTYEAGNELTRDPAIILNSNYAGTTPSDFNNQYWPILRGVIRGMIDGVKSVQSTARVGVNFCVADIAAADMLWEGKQPNGSAGYTPVNWDITTWHNYSPYGDLFNIGIDGAGPGFNLPVYAKARYGVPFMITEWNAAWTSSSNPVFTDSQRASYLQQQLSEYYNARKTNAIESTMFYELIQGDYSGLMFHNLTQIQPEYNAFQSFVQQNPDN